MTSIYLAALNKQEYQEGQDIPPQYQAKAWRVPQSLLEAIQRTKTLDIELFT